MTLQHEFKRMPDQDQHEHQHALSMVKHWHSDAHLPARRHMIVRLRKLDSVMKTKTQSAFWPRPDLVLRLELMLYKAANSMDEYLNECTLERRIQALVTYVSPKPSTRKRKLADDAASLMKKPRKVTSSSAFFLNGNCDVLQHVFKFLDGQQAWRCRAINRFASIHVPSMVHSLVLDAANSLLNGHVVSILTQCTHLNALTIVNSRNIGQRIAKACVTSSAFSGPALLAQVAQAFDMPTTCVRLQSLEIWVPFDSATDAPATISCLQSFCTSTKRSLHRLVLNSNVMGDTRVQQLATLMTTHPMVFRELHTLSLRNNFMGDAGFQAVMHEMMDVCGRSLQVLDLSRNILTDVHAMALSQTQLPALLVLNLKENYVGYSGFHALAKQTTQHATLEIRYEQNCLEPHDARRLFN